MLSDRLLFNSRAANTDIGPNLFVWGNNGSGGLGLSNVGGNRSSPVQLPGTWTQSSFPGNHNGANASSFMKPEGTLWMCGYGGWGSLGIGTTTTHSSPVQVAGAWLMAGTGARASFGIKSDGSLWAWGNSHTSGVLGLGDTINRSSPVQLAGTWRWIVAGNYSAVGIRSNGALFTWGDNSYGGLGLGGGSFSGNQSSPVQISGTWIKAVAGNTGSLTNGAGIKSDGSLWTWGCNNYGMIGAGTGGSPNLNESSPVQISGTWRDVATGSAGLSFIALRHDGALFTWGRNTYGQLGQVDQGVNRSSPVQIAGTWTHLAQGSLEVMAFKSGGALWAWGRNGSGQLGLGHALNVSSPVQLAGTWAPTSSVIPSGSSKGLKIT